jgi:hypothetical protein
MKLLSYEYQVGTSYNLAAFAGTIFKLKATESLELSMERLGGEFQPDLTSEKAIVWKFPSYIHSNSIEEILKNTCFECGGLMENGTVIRNQEVRVLTDNGYIPYPEGPATVQQCRKCTSCGHSHIQTDLLP